MEEFRVDTIGEAQVIRFAGEITMDNARELKNRGRQVVEGQGRAVVMDLSKVTFIDSSGIGFLIVLKSRCDEAGKRFALLSPSVQVRKTLRLVQLDAIFPVAANEGDLTRILSL